MDGVLLLRSYARVEYFNVRAEISIHGEPDGKFGHYQQFPYRYVFICQAMLSYLKLKPMRSVKCTYWISPVKSAP